MCNKHLDTGTHSYGEDRCTMIKRLLAVAGLSEPEAEGEDSCSPVIIYPSATTPVGTEERALVWRGGKR